ncbi:hypothetical protein FSP39_011701 [Pinctada imbricata]|uniref:G-protein coupled receptors family 1 profile domain-containing protein n=1 Tax=Pinctada imbricata TaxID=66713 RepID=A0AA88Y4T3_PINIB|nr:hypothetical protein FSP39_011701 [Pinctada imbricata]
MDTCALGDSWSTSSDTHQMLNKSSLIENRSHVTSEEETLTDAAYVTMGIYLTILGLSSLICNGMVIIVLLKGNTKFLRIHVVLLLNLAITDSLISIVAFPLSSASSYHGRWLFGEAGCTYYGFLVFFLAMGDMNTLVAISISRYIVACKPKYEYLLKERSNIKWVLIAIWAYSLIWTGPPLIGWSKYTTEKYGTSCTINWYGREIGDLSYNTVITFTCFVVHATIFIFCYSNIIRQYKVADNLKDRTVTADDDNENSMNIEDVVWYHKVTTSRSITLTSLGMISAYTLAWTPYAIISMWVMYISDVPVWIHVLPTMMGKSACLVNPIVYGICSENFRKAVKALFVKRVVHPRAQSGIEMEENDPNTSRNDSSAGRASGGMPSGPAVLPVSRDLMVLVASTLPRRLVSISRSSVGGGIPGGSNGAVLWSVF